jgi:hypothetical protein
VDEQVSKLEDLVREVLGIRVEERERKLIEVRAQEVAALRNALKLVENRANVMRNVVCRVTGS